MAKKVETRRRPYVILVTSDKGGVGKTVVAVNLAVALRGLGYRALLIDSNIINPSVALQLDLEPKACGIVDILKGTARINEVIVKHEPSGIWVMPCLLGSETIVIDDKMFGKAYWEINNVKGGLDFVVIDSAPGSKEYISIDLLKKMHDYVDDTLIVTAPELVSVVNAVKLGVLMKSVRMDYRILVNMKRKKLFEFTDKEIKDVVSKIISADLPWDDTVPKSLYNHIPAVMLAPHSRFSRVIDGIAKFYISRSHPNEKHERFRQFREDEGDYEKRMAKKRRRS